MEKKATSTVIIGLVISLILIVISLVIYFTGMYTESWIQYLTSCIFLGAIIYAVINHGKETNNTATFGNLFGYGFKVAATVTVIMVLYTVLSMYIFPDVKAKFIEIARQKALENPGANESQIEQGMAMYEKNFTLFTVIGIIFWYLILGVVASLIGAAVTKKRPNATPFENV